MHMRFGAFLRSLDIIRQVWQRMLLGRLTVSSSGLKTPHRVEANE